VVHGKFDVHQLVTQFRDFVTHKTVEEGWMLYVDVNTPDITAKIWRKQEPDGAHCWQAWSILQGVTCPVLLKLNKDYEFRRKYMEYTTSYYPLETKEEENGDYKHTVYWRVKLPFVGYFTAEREYLFYRTQVQVDDVTVVLDESIDHHDQVPKNPSYVRVDNYNSAMIFRDKEGGCTEVMIKYLTPLNIKMPIPQSLLNWGAGVGLNKYLGAIKKAIEEYQDKSQTEETEREVDDGEKNKSIWRKIL